MHFLVMARDGTDEGALDRRLAVREDHLAGARKLKEQGHFIKGGALLDDKGRMCGSVIMMNFPDRAALDAWLAWEPYATNDVWRDITVSPFKIADI